MFFWDQRNSKVVEIFFTNTIIKTSSITSSPVAGGSPILLAHTKFLLVLG